MLLGAGCMENQSTVYSKSVIHTKENLLGTCRPQKQVLGMLIKGPKMGEAQR